MDKLYIVMPAYNEAANIRKVVEDWYPILSFGSEESRLVISDVGSTDDTHKILEELQKEYDKLVIFSECEKQHGPKLIAMYKYAYEQGADWIFQTDSDGQTNPDEFEAFWEARNTYDVVCGDRQVRGDGAARAFIEKVVCMLLSMYYRVKVPDANAPFRLMKASVVNKYMDRFEPDYNIPNIMLTTFFVYYQDKIVFRNISFKPRQGGENSINVPKIVKIGIKALSDFRQFKKGM